MTHKQLAHLRNRLVDAAAEIQTALGDTKRYMNLSPDDQLLRRVVIRHNLGRVIKSLQKTLDELEAVRP